MESSEGIASAQPAALGAQGVATPARISERLTVLDTLAARPLAEHAETYQRLHSELQDALAEIDGP